MMEMKHSMRSIDPPGEENRRWRCVDCGKQGQFDEFFDTDCIDPEFIDLNQRLLDAVAEPEELE